MAPSRSLACLAPTCHSIKTRLLFGCYSKTKSTNFGYCIPKDIPIIGAYVILIVNVVGTSMFLLTISRVACLCCFDSSVLSGSLLPFPPPPLLLQHPPTLLLLLLLLLVLSIFSRLLATVEGRPLPTELPQRPPPSSGGGGGYGGGFGNGGGGGGGGVDGRSMERMAGETDSEYVARQTALRGEASARMRDKFGGPNRMQVRKLCEEALLLILLVG